MTASGRRINAEVAPLLPADARVSLRLEEIPEFRAAQVWPEVPESEAVERFERTVPGEPQVRLRIHRPRLAGPLPCVFWIHGGGLIRGSCVSGDALLQRWAERLGFVGVAVSYRLAPQHPYPAALDDCDAGLRWVHDHADELGVDPARIGVAGYSAGGGLAAALALRARDRGSPPVAFQLLQVPMLDDRCASRSSQWQVGPWYPATNRTAWQAYLGGRADVPAYAAPARATDLRGLPPAFLSIGGADVFFDEDVAYAQELVHADVPTEFHVYQDAPHGFDLFAPESHVGRRALRDIEEWLASTPRSEA